MLNVVQKLRKSSLKTSLETILKVLVKENSSLAAKKDTVSYILTELCEEGQIFEKKISGLENYRMPCEMKSSDTNTIIQDTSLPEAYVSHTDFTSLVQDLQDFKKFTTEKLSNFLEISNKLELALHENTKLADVNQLRERTIASLTESINHLRDELQHKNIVIQNLTGKSCTENNITSVEKISSREHKQTPESHAGDVRVDAPKSDEHSCIKPWCIVTRKSNTGRLVSSLADSEWLIESSNRFENLSLDQNKAQPQPVDKKPEDSEVHRNNNNKVSATNTCKQAKHEKHENQNTTRERRSNEGTSMRSLRTNHRLDNDVFRAKGRTTAILGDSMLKGQKSWEMRQKLKQNIVIKSFSGASTNDLKDHCKPTLRRAPDHIILATGANDLQSKDTADEIR